MANILSRMPAVKAIVKRVYVCLNAIFHHKPYNVKFLSPISTRLWSPKSKMETFGGYYDKSSVNGKGLVVYYRTDLSTNNKPVSSTPIEIRVECPNHDIIIVGKTSCYNWQQGARAQWISDDLLMYNYFDGEDYKAGVFSVNKKQVVKQFALPVQDAFATDYFLSINYRRIMSLCHDYGYRNLPLLSKQEIKLLNNDGIWKVNYSSGESHLILSLEDIIKVEPQHSFVDSDHSVNHLMIRPDGKGFIFIHRWYHKKRRFDRLMYYDFNSLKVLAAENMVSHMCWVDDHTVFGFLRKDGKTGFFFIDIVTGESIPNIKMTMLGTGDGHPSACGDWIVFDTYPDKSCMEKLFLYNRVNEQILPIVELYHPLKFHGETRCDLHPRFSPDGNKIFFDSVYSGKRQLCGIDVSKITLN